LSDGAHDYVGGFVVIEGVRAFGRDQQRTDNATVASADRKADEAADGKVGRRWLVQRRAIQQVRLAELAAGLEQGASTPAPSPNVAGSSASRSGSPPLWPPSRQGPIRPGAPSVSLDGIDRKTAQTSAPTASRV
jgi:hypothetical protein